MKLKAIEMQGFKSFPEKTKLTFGDGVTAVVGPNGSGKSNISDAIRWVLGEMSVKSLRGGRMEDVIFNGTDKRPAANYAAVSLYLDTSEEHAAGNRKEAADVVSEETSKEISGEKLPDIEKDAAAAVSTVSIAPAGTAQKAVSVSKIRLSDKAEFVITRKYYRTGESEYYINKKQVRLKDVYELFYDTGIGREGYSVIGQGKIAEVLSQKGNERRSIFEETAGISKFRYRKEESERKLSETDRNLERVGDILAEVESRVKPLFEEAEKAKSYLILAEERKKLEITLWLEKVDKALFTLENGKAALAAAKLELDLSTEELDKTEKAEEEFTRRGYALMREKSALEEKAAQNAEQTARLVAQNTVYETEIKNYAQKIEKAKEQILAVSASETETAARLLEIEKENASKQTQLGEIEVEMKTLAKERESFLEKILLKREEKAAFDKEKAKTEEASSLLLAREASLKALLSAAEKSGGDFEARRRQSRARIEALEGAVEAQKKDEEACARDIDKRKEKLSANENETAAVKNKRAETEKKFFSLNAKKAAVTERREALHRLERLFEGYADSVKTVMRRAEEGQIRHDGKTIRLCGTVASLFSTESDYVAAIETALGGAVQFIVSESETCAKAALHYLKSTGGGRVTILPLDTVKGRRYDVSRIKDSPGFIGIAADLVNCEAAYRKIADELLGRVVIARNIDDASEIARKSGYGVKIVTFDGQVINAGGSYTGGSPQKKVGILTRSSDLEKLEKEIAAIGKETSALRRELDLSDEKLRLAENEKTALDAQIALLAEKLEGIRNGLAEKRGVLGEETKKLDELMGFHTRGENEKSALLKESTLLQNEKENLFAAKEKAEKAVREKETELGALSLSAEKIKDAQNEASLRLVTARAKWQSGDEKARELRLRLAEDRRQILRENHEITESEKAVTQNRAAVLEGEKQKRAHAETAGVIAAKKAEIERLLEKREASLASRRAGMDDAKKRREEAFLAHARLQEKHRAVKAEYDEIQTRLWDEYALTYSGAEDFRLAPEEQKNMPSRLNAVKAKIRAMGAINVGAVEEYEETKARRDFLKKQTDDLYGARRRLQGEITRLDAAMEETFVETFEKINAAFGAVFVELFGGGHAKLELSDPENPLGCGIDIILRLPGKPVKSISLLSGGEQSFTAIALYLSLQEINPSPFCIFDEIEAALDEVNQTRLMDYIRAHCARTQYILITHRRATMERADVLFGVTMRERGVSEYLALTLEDVTSGEEAPASA